MWTYDRKLQYPVNIKRPNPKTAQLIISQLGGPDGELNAAMRYLNQRYSMPYREVVGILTDVGTEELAHLEMVAAILYQLTKGLSEDEIEASPFATYFIDHTTGIYPAASAGFPDTMSAIETPIRVFDALPKKRYIPLPMIARGDITINTHLLSASIPNAAPLFSW